MTKLFNIGNSIKQLTLETLDNPGWELRIERQSKGLESECRRSFINDSDWFIKNITPEAISLSGGAKKLLYCCQEALGLLGISLSEELLNDYKAALLFLQDWYSKQCDGDWEHHYGVTIHMDANGLCRCVIDLEDTFGELGDKHFEPWGDLTTGLCQKKEQKFFCEGPIFQFPLLLNKFQTWVEINLDNSTGSF